MSDALGRYVDRQLARVEGAWGITRVKIKSGDEETHWLSITSAQLAKIKAILTEED